MLQPTNSGEDAPKDHTDVSASGDLPDCLIASQSERLLAEERSSGDKRRDVSGQSTGTSKRRDAGGRSPDASTQIVNAPGASLIPHTSGSVQTLSSHISSYAKIDQLLEKEKQHNKTESWNKLDKTIKMQKLHGFAEKYGRENTLANKDIKSLKMFFSDCLEKNKLQKSKDVIYNKDSNEIQSIPSLFFHPVNRNFTLKIIDPKRVSTLKSLTPKRALPEFVLSPVGNDV